jgi:hypothetical protein
VISDFKSTSRKTVLLLSTFAISLCALVAFSTECYPGSAKSTITKKVLGLFDDSSKAAKKSKKAIPGAIGGSSLILRSRIATKPGYQAHHLIPVELKRHRTLNKIGMDIDEAGNGISLPQYPGLDPILPLHRGSHPDYTFAVKNALDKIPDNLSVSETRKAVSAAQNSFRSLLESGVPLHTKQGGNW